MIDKNEVAKGPLAEAAKPEDEDFFDLQGLDTRANSNEGAEFQLVNPDTGAKLPIFITVTGKHGDTFREIIRDRSDNSIKKAALAQQQGVDPELVLSAQMERDNLELLAGCTLAWRSVVFDKDGKIVKEKPIIKHNGQELDFNAANALKLYDQVIWIRSQVDNAIGNLSLFIKA